MPTTLAKEFLILSVNISWSTQEWFNNLTNSFVYEQGKPTVILKCANGKEFCVDEKYLELHKPEPLGYYIQNGDGTNAYGRKDDIKAKKYITENYHKVHV